MEPRLAAGRQATEQRLDANLSKASSKTTEGAVALADQLVLEFLFMELTEPQAAQMAKTAGDGAQLQFISAMFDRNPVLEQLAASAVIQILGAALQRTLRHHEEFDESAVTVENSQHIRLLYQIREVLQRRNTLQHTANTTDVPRTLTATTFPTSVQLQQQDSLCSSKTAVCNKHCESCENNQQKLLYLAQLMENIRIEQSNLNKLVSQHDVASDVYKASTASSNKPTPARTTTQDGIAVRMSKTTEKLEGNDITMSVKIYIPSPPAGIKCSYIGRLIGPNGITIRELQLETRCHIAVRGRGSIKDSRLFRKMRHKPGFGHLREDTHVLVEAKAANRAECRSLIEKAKKRISDMFTPEFDSLKREQLIHLAMLNGTYRQSITSAKPT
ncbi:unnamed protein product [Cylicocyclus nassatus]|uniref:K Homology domain-containing protein n=1 Tax=Cylicocyclus nassatus TaxID=53992 RepID=A0AA36GVL2_CYLNA|nr:unnamed protein product [Cylicocyclus nassatus]